MLPELLQIDKFVHVDNPGQPINKHGEVAVTAIAALDQGWLHVPSALFLGKNPRISAGWVPQPEYLPLPRHLI